ncbi:hypothetical protein KAW08_03865 [bacterium]|nr:hypothetical protein [bacterium]
MTNFKKFNPEMGEHPPDFSYGETIPLRRGIKGDVGADPCICPDVFWHLTFFFFLLFTVFISGCSPQWWLVRNSYKPDAKLYINPCVRLRNYEIAYIQKPERNGKSLTADDRIIQKYIKGEINIAFERAGFFQSVTYDKKVLNKANVLKITSNFTVDYGNQLWRSHLGFLGFGKTKILLEIKLKDAKTNIILSRYKDSLIGTGWETIGGGDPKFLIKKDIRKIVRFYVDLLRIRWRKNQIL